MIERAIEHWLTNTNERNYKTAFVQVLAHQGYQVLTVPADGPMEQGKDLLTIDPTGHPCAFQLKTGPLDLARWRRYRDEMMELIQLPIYHPAVDRSTPHRAVLVANGEMTNEVRVQIDQINADNQAKGRGWATLEVTTLQPLLRDFIAAQGKFIPRELDDLRAFLDVYQADGTDCFPVEKFAALVERVFLQAGDRPSDARNAITSSLVFTSYLLHPFQLTENHFAAFEAWTTLGASILRHALTHHPQPDGWARAIELVQAEMVRNLLALRSEALQRPDFLEGEWFGDGGAMHSTRALVTLGAAAAATSHLLRRSVHDPEAGAFLDLLRKSDPYLQQFWGESAFPFVLHIAKLCEHHGQSPHALDLLTRMFEQVIDGYSRESATSAPSLYFKAPEALAAAYGLVEEDLDLGQFSGRSGILRSLLEMLARRGHRRPIAEHWRRASRILFEEFRPDQPEDVFAWRAAAGQSVESWPAKAQSWSALHLEARDLSRMPQFYLQFAEFLSFLIMVYPHRCTPEVIRTLDTQLASGSGGIG